MQALSLVPHERPASGLIICMDAQVDVLSCRLPFISRAPLNTIVVLQMTARNGPCSTRAVGLS
jgi:hypothetical protein